MPLSYISIDPDTGVTLGLQRALLDLYTSLAALTTPQKNAIWNDLTRDSPPKWSLDRSPDAAAIMACSMIAVDNPFGWASADARLVKARLEMAAAYLRVNPSYLLNQTFGNTVAAINVPGYE